MFIREDFEENCWILFFTIVRIKGIVLSNLFVGMIFGKVIIVDDYGQCASCQFTIDFDNLVENFGIRVKPALSGLKKRLP